MAIRNVWTITPNKKVISYRLQYTSSPDVQEDISNLHREIAYVFGGFPLDISLNSPKAVGSELSVAKQRLDDKAVFDVCKSLMKDKENDGSKEFASSAAIILIGFTFRQFCKSLITISIYQISLILQM